MLWRPPQALRSRAAWGQEQFQLLLQCSPPAPTGSQEAEALEDLRYRWMLHKSKLKDVTQVRARSRTKAKVRGTQVPTGGGPSGGPIVCPHLVCCHVCSVPVCVRGRVDFGSVSC